ncbi:DUF2087 domain-containing protein [uncultured Litoreibacter sp.]|uniref:DUF2087 domain-containing protein n=1 Tax=uncultured Litoreibacter sp. TaxID=1392394 RepID=UPI002615E61A|nr:DUF2087 domain-containing protein [uncultured Litoreibacter sp.]
MSSHPIPLVIEDVSQFARALRKHWPDEPPGHANMLSLVAKAAGYRNHQVLKAEFGLPAPEAAFTELEERRLRDALRVFDLEGQMTRWPLKTSVQGLCLAIFWATLPARRDLTEKEVNAVLKSGEVFGDHVLLRRCLIEHNMVTRERDGSIYRRVERKPSPLERALIRAVSECKHAAMRDPIGGGRPAFKA